MPPKLAGAQLAQLIDRLERQVAEDSNHEALVATLTQLVSEVSHSDAHEGANTQEAAEKLSTLLGRLILPANDSVFYDNDLEDAPPGARLLALSNSKERALHGLNALESLLSLHNASSEIDPSVLIALTAHTSALDPWTSSTTISTAETLLGRLTEQTTTENLVITHILQNFIRPLFAKSKGLPSITSTGRKAMTTSAPPSRFDSSDLDQEKQPWRYEVVYAVSVLDWAMENIPQEAITPNLHLIIPPLLHLLDTSSTTLRHRGLVILPKLVQKMTPQTLTQTGLGSVFENAVAPTLMFLPSLTPLKESELLVPTAWNAIFTLCDVWFSAPSTSSSTTKPTPSKQASPLVDKTPSLVLLPKISTISDFATSSTTRILPSPNTRQTTNRDSQQAESKRIKYLLTHLRDSLLPAFTYTQPAYPSLTTILLLRLSELISRLGVSTTKHLKDIIPLSTSLLLDPFSKMDMMLASLGVLKGVLLNAWARIAEEEPGRWRMEILKGVVGCWSAMRLLSSSEEEEGAVERMKELLQSELGVVARLLVRVVEVDPIEDRVVEFRGHIEKLIEADNRLRGVFSVED